MIHEYCIVCGAGAEYDSPSFLCKNHWEDWFNCLIEVGKDGKIWWFSLECKGCGLILDDERSDCPRCESENSSQITTIALAKWHCEDCGFSEDRHAFDDGGVVECPKCKSMRVGPKLKED